MITVQEHQIWNEIIVDVNPKNTFIHTICNHAFEL